ncbi:hypothetical protein GOODEAATRI_017249 [Goodea atripinnis]|uniref:Uncharacterized protein n=1 Tax=Goodea atripinnis TaxID=208336 RepID=A0ABV0PZA8_9TELE
MMNQKLEKKLKRMKHPHSPLCESPVSLRLVNVFLCPLTASCRPVLFCQDKASLLPCRQWVILFQGSPFLVQLGIQASQGHTLLKMLPTNIR